MVEVMNRMANSFKSCHACLAALSAPDPAAGRGQPTAPPETLGHPRASLGQPLVGSWLLSPGSWCTQGFDGALRETFPPVLHKFWQLLWECWWWPPIRGLMPHPGVLLPEPLPLWPATADLHLLRRHSNTVLSRSLWGLWVLVCTRFVWGLWASVWQVWGLMLNVISSLRLLLCPCTRGIFFWWDSTFSFRRLFSSKLLIF